jgi:hypothetical protein
MVPDADETAIIGNTGNQRQIFRTWISIGELPTA